MFRSGKRVLVFHLLNGYTGSVKVIRDVIDVLIINGYEVEIVTSNTEGFLSDIKDVHITKLKYNWNSFFFVTFILFIIAQIKMFLIAFKKADQFDIYYINTILPFGASFAAWLRKKIVIYHVHEVYLSKSFLSKVYIYFLKLTASKVVFVSHYLKKQYNVMCPSVVIYNTLNEDFLNIVSLNRNLLPFEQKQDILMISSLKEYKGVFNFIHLASLMPDYTFKLILSVSQDQINLQFRSTFLPSNIKIFPVTSDLHPYYSRAKVNMNMTIPNKCIETFGMTVLESMSYGIPNIIPPVGGPCELVEDDLEGYRIHPENYEALVFKIKYLYSNDKKYNEMSKASYEKSTLFSRNIMTEAITIFLSNS